MTSLNLTSHPGISLEWLRKTAGTSVRTAGLRTEIRIRGLPKAK
jgi:hypothetical protein